MNKFLKKAAVSALTAVMALCGSFTAFADNFNTGDYIDGLAIQIVVQNGESAENAYKWMNDGACEDIQYNTEQHIVLEPAADAFDLTADVLKMSALYLGYYGTYSKSEEAQIDISITNAVIYLDLEGYDPIALQDYSSVDAGTNMVEKGNNFAIIYDFQDQFNAATRTFILQNLGRIEFDMTVSYIYLSDAPEAEEVTTVEETEEETTTVEETTEKETTVKETTEEETEVVTEEVTTAQDDAAIETTAVAENETTQSAAQGEEKNSLVKIIIVIAFSVILIGALIAVAVMYVKKR